ncbi:alpha/beta family hydrolase [Gordonia sp. NB41Y]|uniref:alpha/beta hydrolase family protein n=1 Tax=Gordonia sp. NB41Y TaxID=875808 RepID=UPI0006B1F9E8|nr:alpha/beta family hydrolase [Gordonia sp. NB41Y]EMP10101.2 alpha/beta hydrolase [Gordonia sp. NB41Y]WLP90181.1 alpha/beta hydrolase [Gordonia sp. NB41Y]
MTVSPFTADGVVADVHRPHTDPIGLVVLAHGAGGNRDAKILHAYADEFCGRGFVVARIDLPYRQRHPKGPPSPSTAPADRDGIRAAVAALRGEADGPLVVGGHSYGGRQVSMVIGEDGGGADLLLLSSYPLHPPGKPERARIEHLPDITVPTVVVHGSNDPFATTDEITEALTLIPAPTRLVEIDKGGHDLKPDRKPTAPEAADAVTALLAGEPS